MNTFINPAALIDDSIPKSKIRNNGSVGITYSDLKTLRDNGELEADTLYRITDYVATTTQQNTTSAGHQFDIIVLAIDNSHISENAYAIKHDGDTYFANTNFDAWELKYSLDNDINKFVWADATNGKGVIYKMIDEFGNNCPYDFKNIQFYRKWDATLNLWSEDGTPDDGVAAYTFSSQGDDTTTSFNDNSLDGINNKTHSSIIKEYIGENGQRLNNICIFGNNSNNNLFENYCANITLSHHCYKNTFNYSCAFNKIGANCAYNTFDSGCTSNTLYDSCNINVFGTACSNNIIKSNCIGNIFDSACMHNTIGNNCSYNKFGSGCSYIVFASTSDGSSIGNNFKNITLERNVKYFVLYNNDSDTSPVKNYYIKSSIVGTSDAKIAVQAVRNKNCDTTVAKSTIGSLKIYCDADYV